MMEQHQENLSLEKESFNNVPALRNKGKFYIGNNIAQFNFVSNESDSFQDNSATLDGNTQTPGCFDGLITYSTKDMPSSETYAPVTSELSEYGTVVFPTTSTLETKDDTIGITMPVTEDRTPVNTDTMLSSEIKKVVNNLLINSQLNEMPSGEQSESGSSQVILLSTDGALHSTEKYLLIPISALSSSHSLEDLIPVPLTTSKGLAAAAVTQDEAESSEGETLSTGGQKSMENHQNSSGSRQLTCKAQNATTTSKHSSLTAQRPPTEAPSKRKRVNIETLLANWDENKVASKKEDSNLRAENSDNENSVVDSLSKLVPSLDNAGGNKTLPLDLSSMNKSEQLATAGNLADSMVTLKDGMKKWTCSYCDKLYTSKHNLVIHILGHYEIRQHTCAQCGKKFKQVSHLNTHLRTHSEDRQFECDVCFKQFIQSAHLIRHRMLHEENPKPYQCNRCPRSFVYPSELKLHQQRHETKDRMAADSSLEVVKSLDDRTCKECDKVFAYPSLLKEHMIKHSGQRPHICRECGQQFMKPHHLKTHKLTHTGDKPHKCHVCQRGFTLKSNMERHLLTHFPTKSYKCDICGKFFSQKQILQSHMVTHSDKKPFSCKICSKQFSRLHNLEGHMTLHNQNKKYICFCGCSFTLKGNLNRHQKDVHKMSKFTNTSQYSAEEAAIVLNSMSQTVKPESELSENNVSE